MSSTGAVSRPPTSSDPTAKEYVDPTAVVVPHASSSSDSFLRSMLDTIMFVHAAYG